MVNGETRKMRDTAVEWCGREERGWGEHAAVAWGKKPQRRSENEHPKTIKERKLLEKESHHPQNSQKPAYNVFPNFALSRRIVETAFLEWTIGYTTESVSLAKLALFDRFAPVSSLAQVSRVNDSHACMHFYRGSARLWHRHLHFTAPSILSSC
jgi:hypothetical protein